MSKNETEKRRLYHERSSTNIDEQVQELDKIEKGEIPCLELSADEKKEIYEFESRLSEQLETIVKMNSHSYTMGLDYLLTSSGREDFKNIFGQEVEGENLDGLKVFIQKMRKKIEDSDVQARELFAGRTSSFADEKLKNELLKNINEQGELNIENAFIPSRTSFMLGPKDALEKIESLRELKKNILTLIDAEKEENNTSQVKKTVLNMYRKLTNTYIANNYFVPAAIMETKNSLGEKYLNKEEVALLNQYTGQSNTEKNLARMDKFLCGASTNADEKGFYPQIGKELEEMADRMETSWLENVINSKEKIKAKGIDPEKISKATISETEVRKLAEETLEHYGLLSSMPPEEYKRDRKVPAPDNKWQIIISPDYKNMSVDGRQKVVLIGSGNKNIQQVLNILISHEIEGHVLQNENKEKLNLKIFKTLGTDRAEIFSEGGAMENQNDVSKKIFGIESTPLPHYTRAMSKRLLGGNYLECVKESFESATKEQIIKRQKGVIDQDQFNKELTINLELAINRTQRLFRPFTAFDSKKPNLTNSGATIYIGQVSLLENLKKFGKKKYAFVGGLNIPNLSELTKAGLLKISDIQEPEFYANTIWLKIKENYQL